MRTNRTTVRGTLLSTAVLASLCALTIPPSAIAQAVEQPQAWNIAAGPLDNALNRLATQSKLAVLYSPDLVAGKTTKGLSGQYAPTEALRRLLDGTGLVVDVLNETTYVLKRATEAASGASQVRPSSTSRRDQTSLDDERVVGMPAIMVEGARTLNMDITRTRNDPQPYVVFDRELIERSGATSIEQLLQQRLPMNSGIGSVGSGMRTDAGDLPATSGINLRGLGDAQTLILIDGHRMSGPMVFGGRAQGEISGVPLASVERIEILPSTASGIYGGSATGGVINIITRKDYSGGEVRMTYDNTFSTDSAIRKLDFVFGHNFNQGRTNLLLSAAYSDANELVEADRSFNGPGRAQIWNNNPDYFIGPWSAPLGSTPNIVSADGSDLVLKSGVALGSSYTSVPLGYAGVAPDGGAALAANAGIYNWDLPSGPLGRRRTLYSEPMVKSGTLVLRHRFSDSFQAFVDLSSSSSRRRFLAGGWSSFFTLPVDSPYNPFTTAVQAVAGFAGGGPQESTTERDRAVAGVIKQLPGDWQLSLDYTWDRTTMNFSGGDFVFGDLQSVFGAGDVDILRDLEAFPFDVSPYLAQSYIGATRTTMKDANIRISGPLGSLPAGQPVLSAAIAHRDEATPEMLQRSDPTFHLFYPARSTAVSSIYMEYRVPLFSTQNERPGFKELELQLAARYEDYKSRSGQLIPLFGDLPSPLPDPLRVSNEFSSTDPTIALRWKPFRDIVFRVSHGTGFVPPALNQLVPIGSAQTGLLYTASSDPRRGNTPTGQFTGVFNGNPDLKPESSSSWSAGMILMPAALPGLRLSVDYTRVKKTDNIGTIPGFVQGVIDNEALFPDRVVRGPNLPDDPAGWAGPIIHVDATPLNLASAELEAWDVQLDYRLDTEARGSFDLFLVGTWQPKYAIQLMSGRPMVDYVGRGGAGLFASYPLEFKANAGLTWNVSAWRIGWNMSYFDSYLASASNATILANQGNDGRIPSQTYHDAFVNYDFGLSSGEVPGWLAGTAVQLGVRNLFNQKPPFDAGRSPSYYSPYGNPRLASYYFTLTKRF